MIYELIDTKKAEKIFSSWHDTLIYSCLDKIMGKIYVTDLNNPESACAIVNCFAFYSGVPNKELIINKPEGFLIMTPQNDEWGKLIEECYPNARKAKRYAFKKDTKFDQDKLERYINELPSGYEIKRIDSHLYDMCLQNDFTRDFVSSFETKERFLSLGVGMVILKDGIIVSGASSFSRYKGGIEIEVDTLDTERRKNLATCVCSALIIECLKMGLYPSWDAQNLISVHLAQKLGYEFSHEYIVYEV